MQYMGFLEFECIQARCQSVFISEIMYSFIQHYVLHFQGGRKGSGQALSHLFTYLLAGCVILASFKPRHTESHGAE